MRNMKRVQKGFTLIELMIVIAIVAILVALAVPAYQDYTVRAKVSECINSAAPAKLAVSEAYMSQGALPGTDDEAGFSHAATQYCATVAVGGNGVITVTTQATGAQGAAPAAVLTPTPVVGSGAVDWACTIGAGEARYFPRECRT